jgi:ABC-type glutathione transport system ATPase component
MSLGIKIKEPTLSVNQEWKKDEGNQFYTLLLKNNSSPILSVHHLSVTFPKKGRFFVKEQAADQVLSDINFELYQGKITALVGESGSGKTTIGKTIVGLVRNFTGEFQFEGIVYNPLNMSHLRTEIQYIFQDSLSALNPRMTAGQILNEILLIHHSNENVDSILEQVELQGEVAGKYPYELSGGQRQRVNIARALAVNPQVLICDEVVSALDVSIQAKILNLITRLVRERNLAILFITHDLNVVRAFVESIIVLSKGEIVEKGDALKIMDSPEHFYTKTLIAAMDF